ncbi:hypothetical protein [Kitasatospora azatica]|uniref:hypothetical protein n=1 Tax=Kitasatospora azatica TaxID=58347 RepID=UPI00068C6B08|nr:hypothetical protein [Kitasatospora azatica]
MASTQRHLGAESPMRMHGGLLGELAVARRVRGVRRLCTLGAAGAMVLVGALLAVRLAPPAGRPAPLPTSPAVQLVLWGEQHSAVDPRTGLAGTVGLESKQWGTHIGLDLSRLTGPLKCSLIAVSKQGERENITSWNVPAAGYGVPGHPEHLIVHGGAAIALPDLDHFEVATMGGDRLLSIPAQG